MFLNISFVFFFHFLVIELLNCFFFSCFCRLPQNQIIWDNFLKEWSIEWGLLRFEDHCWTMAVLYVKWVSLKCDSMAIFFLFFLFYSKLVTDNIGLKTNTFTNEFNFHHFITFFFILLWLLFFLPLFFFLLSSLLQWAGKVFIRFSLGKLKQ